MSFSAHSGGSTTACAACKYQRKKCTKNCLLAPYFPQDRPKQFLNAHKLFGVSNITKMINGVEESQRDIAMQNLIYHANARALDPIGGLYRVMCDLKRKIECCQAELNFTHQQIAMCRSLAHQQEQRQRQDLPFGCYSYGELLQQEDEYVNVDGYGFQNVQQHQEMQQQESPINYEMLLKMPEQTSKVKLEERTTISDQEQNNLLRQILMSSSPIN
ncbi:PREDICTED: LOB domain-containing protein 7-like [Camelina sativa]|uniref:LOB domain-containing protein 7-like n=1 Tax=Camelina sativa TaxID=90675 RepID=A0ABM0STW9_CAMSA|nr:PREDICTED: LOB domain-containing protein 7-like [Camelina sativa]